ncbi:MAG: ABC transporter permease [Planctomycetes bacterium]|nr:ABC transporter permease [Planctomycetota bacterium]
MSASPSHPLWLLVLTRIRLFLRQPEAVFWTYGFPLVMITALGFAFRGQPKTTVLVDIIGPQAAAFEARLASAPRFKITRPADTDWKKRLQTGKTNLVVETGDSPTEPPRFWDEVQRAESLFAREAVENTLLRDHLPNAPKYEESHLEAIGSRYIDFLLPGMIGMNLMGGGMWGIGFVVVDMRVRRLLKRLLATPMRPAHFLLSIMLTRLTFSVFDMIFLLTYGYLAFGVRCAGNYLELFPVMLLGGLSFAGIGLLTASRAQTIDAISGLMNLIMLPMWIASGVFFSAERFPEFMQPIIQALPLTCLNNALRGVMVDGASLTSLWKPLLILLAWGSVSFTIALRIFRWK